MPPSAKNLLPIVLLALLLAAAAWWIFQTYFNTYHLATVQAGVLYRDGVRTLRQFQLAARKTHVKTVVSLVDDQEIRQAPFTDEMAYCQAHGIAVVRIPVALGGWPDNDQIEKFLAIAADPNRQPVLVHCAQGVRRTGMMAAAYQLTVLKYDKAQAEAAILSFGHSRRATDDLRTFIETYDPQTKRMTRQLPASRE